MAFLFRGGLGGKLFTETELESLVNLAVYNISKGVAVGRE